MDVIQRCVDTLHDLAAQSPQAAAETLAALYASETPAADAIGYLIDNVATARHGESTVRAAQRRIRG
jgi:hypothetical protein